MKGGGTGWRSLRRLGARLHEVLGLHGLAGVVLCGGVLLWMAWTWPARHLPSPDSAAVPTAVPAMPEAPALRRALPDGAPSVQDVPRLLTRLERAAVAEGLGWPKADYRLLAATGDSPAVLEIRLVLAGPYPALRRFVAALLLDQPSLTFKAFHLARPSPEALEVEGRFTIAVYLVSEPAVLAGRSGR